jgi:hypothetical protein
MGTNNFLGILDCWLNPHKAFKETETFKLRHYPKAGLIYANKKYQNNRYADVSTQFGAIGLVDSFLLPLLTP